VLHAPPIKALYAVFALGSLRRSELGRMLSLLPPLCIRSLSDIPMYRYAPRRGSFYFRIDLQSNICSITFCAMFFLCSVFANSFLEFLI